MAKIKINNIHGMITNVDERKLNPEIATLLENAREYNGYIKANFHPVREVKQSENFTSRPNDYLPLLPSENWDWETGTFCSIGNDPLSDSTTAVDDEYLVLIAIHDTGEGYERSIWVRKWDEGSFWIELRVDGFNVLQRTYLTKDFFFTTKKGKTFFKNDNGVLKIFMPHDSFWLGYMDRSRWVPRNINATLTTKEWIGGLYLDRLSERTDLSTASVQVTGLDTLGCAEGKRLGIEVLTDVVQTDEIPIETGTKFKFEFKRFETWNSGEDEQQVRICGAKVTEGDSTGNYLTNPLLESYPGGQTTDWAFIRKQSDVLAGWAVDSWLLPVAVNDSMKKENGDDINYTQTHNPYITRSGHTWNTPYIDFYEFPEVATSAEDVTATTSFLWVADKDNIGNSGFEKVTSTIYALTTMFLDETTEIIVGLNAIDISKVTTSKYGIKFNFRTPTDLNKRVTRIRLYMKVDPSATDFTLAKDFDLMQDTAPKFDNLILGQSSLDANGVTLSQNIGLYFDESKSKDYVVKTVFSSFCSKDGVTLALLPGDTNSIYYSTLGGGNLQPDLIYIDNKLPISFKDKLIAIVTINNSFAVIGTNRMFIIRVDEINGSLIFSSQDTLEFGIRDSKDVVEVQGGIILHTQLGIFLTNGNDKNWLSQEINNIIEENWKNYSIFYNPYQQELYYKKDYGSTEFYKYSFQYKNWSKYYIGEADLKEVLMTRGGKIVYLIYLKRLK